MVVELGPDGHKNRVERKYGLIDKYVYQKKLGKKVRKKIHYL